MRSAIDVREREVAAIRGHRPATGLPTPPEWEEIVPPLKRRYGTSSDRRRAKSGSSDPPRRLSRAGATATLPHAEDSDPDGSCVEEVEGGVTIEWHGVEPSDTAEETSEWRWVV